MAGLNAGVPAPTVFVGNLAYDLSEQDIIDYFSQVGPVKTVRIVTDRESGKPRGFGFVEFYDSATSESAIRNLSGKELSGRTIRIVFAEGGPGDGPRGPRREDEMRDDRPRRSSRTKIVGGDLAYHASHGMATLMGQQPQPGAPADQLTVLLARKTRSELYDYLGQMQTLLHQNPQHAREVLIQNPQLTRALFQIEIILGMVSNPLGDIAPKGVAPPGIVPPRHSDIMEGMPPQYAQHPLPDMGYGAPPPVIGGAYPPVYMPPPQEVLPAQPLPADPRLGGAAPPMPVDPRFSMPPQPAGYAPSAPRPMVSVAAGAAAAQPDGPAARRAKMTPEQQALLDQVMKLTPEQINLLPAAQKAQVLALQQQLKD